MSSSPDVLANFLEEPVILSPLLPSSDDATIGVVSPLGSAGEDIVNLLQDGVVVSGWFRITVAVARDKDVDNKFGCSSSLRLCFVGGEGRLVLCYDGWKDEKTSTYEV